MKLFKIIRNTLVFLIAVLLVIFGLLTLNKSKIKDVPQNILPVEETIEKVEDHRIAMNSDLRQKWLDNKEKNPDYLGEIQFYNGLLNVSFVQAKGLYDINGNFYKFFNSDAQIVSEDNYKTACDGRECNGNDVYLWMNWQNGEYDKMNQGGSIFLDYRNTISDQYSEQGIDEKNLIIYGHHFSAGYNPERDRAFTALEKLVEEENYEDNKYFQIVLDNQIRKYVVAYVYEYALEDEGDLQFYRTNFEYDLDGNPTPGFTDKYIAAVKEHAYYDTGVEITKYDNTLTLQTCYSNRPKFRQIIICKELERIDYK